MRRISDDSDGYVFSLDLLIALIPITILLGMAAANMDNVYYLSQQGVFESSLQRVGEDTVDALLETSGTPNNWEQTGNPSVIGIAKYDPRTNAPVENDISPYKLGALNTSVVQELVGPEYGYYINITNAQNNTPYYSLGTFNSSANDIARVERLVRLAKFEIVSQGVGIRGTRQPRDFTNPPNPFQTNIAYNAAFDYYVLIYNNGISSAQVVINGQEVVRERDFPLTELTRKIDSSILQNQTDLQDNSVVLGKVASKPGSTMDVYIVQVPKGTPEGDVTIENSRPIIGRFVFYVWIK
ncbi:MAG: hypothetical protein ACP5C3_00180 [Methanomicrobiales archaeon]